MVAGNVATQPKQDSSAVPMSSLSILLCIGVYLSQPGYDSLQLHVRSSCDVDDDVAELLPVTNDVDSAGFHLKILKWF